MVCTKIAIFIIIYILGYNNAFAQDCYDLPWNISKERAILEIKSYDDQYIGEYGNYVFAISRMTDPTTANFKDIMLGNTKTLEFYVIHIFEDGRLCRALQYSRSREPGYAGYSDLLFGISGFLGREPKRMGSMMTWTKKNVIVEMQKEGDMVLADFRLRNKDYTNSALQEWYIAMQHFKKLFP